MRNIIILAHLFFFAGTGCTPANNFPPEFARQSDQNREELRILQGRINKLESSKNSGFRSDVEGLRNTVKRFYKEIGDVRKELQFAVNTSEVANQRQFKNQDRIENLVQRLSLLEKDIYEFKKQIKTFRVAPPPNSSVAGTVPKVGVVVPIIGNSNADEKEDQQIYRAGLKEFNEKNYKEATKHFQKYIQKNPSGPYTRESFMYLGFSDYETGNYPEAKYYLNETLGKISNSTDSTREKILLYLGYTHEALKDFSVASILFERVVLINGPRKKIAEERLSKIKPQNQK